MLPECREPHFAMPSSISTNQNGSTISGPSPTSTPSTPSPRRHDGRPIRCHQEVSMLRGECRQDAFLVAGLARMRNIVKLPAGRALNGSHAGCIDPCDRGQIVGPPGFRAHHSRLLRQDSSLHATRRLRERRRDASDGAGSPWLVLVREPDQLGVERTHRGWLSVCGSSSSPNQTATSPPTTTGRLPVSTTTTCMPRVWPGAGTSRSRFCSRPIETAWLHLTRRGWGEARQPSA